MKVKDKMILDAGNPFNNTLLRAVFTHPSVIVTQFDSVYIVLGNNSRFQMSVIIINKVVDVFFTKKQFDDLYSRISRHYVIYPEYPIPLSKRCFEDKAFVESALTFYLQKLINHPDENINKEFFYFCAELMNDTFTMEACRVDY